MSECDQYLPLKGYNRRFEIFYHHFSLKKLDESRVEVFECMKNLCSILKMALLCDDRESYHSIVTRMSNVYIVKFSKLFIKHF